MPPEHENGRPEADESVRGNELFPVVYDELRRIAQAYLRDERRGLSLQATDIVHEAWLRLSGDERAWGGRIQYLSVAARAMRRVLVDRARKRRADKRGGELRRVTLAGDEPGREALDVLELNLALDKLAEKSPEQARVVELRYFGGLTIAEIAEVLGMGKRTVDELWAFSKAWLRRELDPSS